MRSSVLIGCALCFQIVGLSGCADIPGKTAAQQAQTIDKLVERTLPELYKEYPQTNKRSPTPSATRSWKTIS